MEIISGLFKKAIFLYLFKSSGNFLGFILFIHCYSCFRCVCEQGFDYFYDSSSSAAICLDLNECDLGRDLCDVNAICLNNEGSYSCQCKRGFTGNGHYCRRNFYNSLISGKLGPCLRVV